MGLGRGAVSLLLREAARRPFAGTVVTLGRQHVYVTEKELNDLALRHRALLHDAPLELHREPSLAAQGFLSDDCLFRRLGFERTVRVDYSSFEACDEVLDLNAADTPTSLQQAFDLVLDSGTMEHVFDVPAVLRHCCRMVKPRGRIIHLTPASNCVEHGFYSVSPTLFADFYAASGFSVDDLCLVRMGINIERSYWDVYDYLHASSRELLLGQLGAAVWFTWSVTTASDAVSPSIPQQAFYVGRWQPAGAATAFIHGEPITSRAGQLLQRVSHSPVLTNAALRLIAFWRRRTIAWRCRRGVPPFPYLGRF